MNVESQSELLCSSTTRQSRLRPPSRRLFHADGGQFDYDLPVTQSKVL